MPFVSQCMKNLVFAFFAAALFSSAAWAGTFDGPINHPVRIEIEAGTPTLTIRNPRIDLRDGKVRGTAYVNFGYAAPRAAHIHAYGLNSVGKVVAQGCDDLSGNLLAPHPRRAGKGRDAFGIFLRGESEEVRVIRLAPHVGKDDC